VKLRAGLPSTVKESLPKSAEFNVYVRDRKPFVRFTGRAYVLPRTGQRGIPLVSVNTPAVNINVFRIGDRNLINTVVDSDFQKTLSSYQLNDLGDEKGVKVWTGELATATTLNQDVITAFPVDQALGDLSSALLTVMRDKSDYAFLSLTTSAFDLTDRGVAGRVVPSGADAFVYAERGVYRSTETVYLTALLRDGQGNAMTGGPLTLVIERTDGVEFRRATLPEQGAGGRSLTVPLNSAGPTGTWRVKAYTDPKGSSVGETTFMVEDYIPERIEFDLSSKDKVIKAEVPVELKVD